MTYPLAFGDVVSYVAVELDKAAPAAVSIYALASNYRHNVPGDLERVRRYEGVTSDAEATLWLVKRAIRDLGPQLVNLGTEVALDDGVRLADLRWQDRPIHAPAVAHLDDPFNPLTGGALARGVRSGKDVMDKLRDSMRTYGWVQHFPALIDERGVVLVGSRRLKVAAELGIPPVIERVRCGLGDDGDIQRLRLLAASNMGSKPLDARAQARLDRYLQLDLPWNPEPLQRQPTEQALVPQQPAPAPKKARRPEPQVPGLLGKLYPSCSVTEFERLMDEFLKLADTQEKRRPADSGVDRQRQRRELLRRVFIDGDSERVAAERVGWSGQRHDAPQPVKDDVRSLQYWLLGRLSE